MSLSDMPSRASSVPSAVKPVRLAVLISGGGTTLVNLQQQISSGHLSAEIVTVIANKNCRGIDRAGELGLSSEVVRRQDFGNVTDFSERIYEIIRQANVDLVILAGFLAIIDVPQDFENRVMNIHPSLIPAFCGKGMYGHHVHEAVVARGCKVSGCTVHFCDNDYDHGPIILQKTVAVRAGESADDVAANVFEAECLAYPEAIQLFAEGRLTVKDGQVHLN